MSRRSSEALQKKRSNGLKDFSGEWKGFVDVLLTDDLKEHARTWSESEEYSFEDAATLLLEDGYKLTLSPDTKHNCVIATATGKAAACINVGYSLSARGPNASAATAVLFYKIYVLLQGQSWEGYEAPESNQLSLWG